MFRRYCVSLLVLHGLLSIHASYGHPIINQIMRLSLDGQTGAVTRSQNFENRLASTKRINQNQETLLLLLELLETMKHRYSSMKIICTALEMTMLKGH